MKRSLNVPALFVCFLLFLLPVSAQQKTWDSLMQEAYKASTEKRFADAEKLCREALTLSGSKKERAEQRRASALAHLATILEGEKKSGEAEATARQALEALEVAQKKTPSELPDKVMLQLTIVGVYLDVADVFATQKKFQEAEAFYKKAIEADLKRQREAPPENQVHSPYQRDAVILSWMVSGLTEVGGGLANSYYKLGKLYFDNRMFDKAEQSFAEAVRLTTVKDAKTGEVRENLLCLTNLGVVFAAQGKYPEAEKTLLHAISEFQKVDKLKSDTAMLAIRNYVLTLKKQGRAAEAETFLDKLQAGEVIVPK